jgi:hypothetical protein
LQAATYPQPLDEPDDEAPLTVLPTPPSVPDTVDTLSSILEGDCDRDCVQWDGTQEQCFDAGAAWEADEPSREPLVGRTNEKPAEGDETIRTRSRPLRLRLLVMLMLAGSVCMGCEPAAVMEFLNPYTCSVDVNSLLNAASALFTLSPEASLPPT